MKCTKYSGYALLATGIIHSLIGLTLGWPILLDMHNSGWFSSTIVNGHIDFKREAIIWFLLAGFFWITFGFALQNAIDNGFSVPAQLGWSFTLIGCVIAYIMPVSGAYLFILQGVLILIENKRQPLITS